MEPYKRQLPYCRVWYNAPGKDLPPGSSNTEGQVGWMDGWVGGAWERPYDKVRGAANTRLFPGTIQMISAAYRIGSNSGGGLYQS